MVRYLIPFHNFFYLLGQNPMIPERFSMLQNDLYDLKTRLHEAFRYQTTQNKSFKDASARVSSKDSSKSNLVMRLVDLPWHESEWRHSSHSQHLLEQHRSLCRQISNLETFQYDAFNNSVRDFIKALDDFMSDNIKTTSGDTGRLNGVSKWPYDNLRILRAVNSSIEAKGGAKAVSLQTFLESYVSISNTFLIFD